MNLSLQYHKMNWNDFKYCRVPGCKTTFIKYPNKLFISVPRKTKIRRIWLKLAGLDPESLSLKSYVYFCEDHFDLPNDMVNYMEYHIMGEVSKVSLKPGCLPSKFDCQCFKGRRIATTPHRPHIIKRRVMPTGKSRKDTEKRSNPAVWENCNTPISNSTLRASQEIVTHLDPQNARRMSKVTGTIQKRPLQVTSNTEHESFYETSVSVPEIEIEVMGISQETVVPSDLDQTPTGDNSTEIAISDVDANDVSMYPDEEETTFLTHNAEPNGEITLSDEFLCSECNSAINGFLYSCVQCSDLFLCGACEYNRAHHQHYVLRVPADRPHSEVVAVLSTIRQHVLLEETDPPRLELDDDISVKLEESDMLSIEEHSLDSIKTLQSSEYADSLTIDNITPSECAVHPPSSECVVEQLASTAADHLRGERRPHRRKQILKTRSDNGYVKSVKSKRLGIKSLDPVSERWTHMEQPVVQTQTEAAHSQHAMTNCYVKLLRLPPETLVKAGLNLHMNRNEGSLT